MEPSHLEVLKEPLLSSQEEGTVAVDDTGCDAGNAKCGRAGAECKRRCLADYFNGLPWWIMFGFFVNSFALAFPDTAVTAWLSSDIQMPPAEVSSYYAVTFLPFVMKPLYAAIAHKCPGPRGERIRPYIMGCSLGAALSYVATATLVRSSRGAFAASFLRAVFNAFGELMLSISLVTFASRQPRNAGAMQSAAYAARAAGSLGAYLIGLPMYPCDGHNTQYNSRAIIASTAIFPLLLAALVARSPPEASWASVATAAATKAGGAGAKQSSSSSSSSSSLGLAAGGRGLVALAGFVAVLLWAGCRDLVAPRFQGWWFWGAGLVLLTVLALCYVMCEVGMGAARYVHFAQPRCRLGSGQRRGASSAAVSHRPAAAAATAAAAASAEDDDGAAAPNHRRAALACGAFLFLYNALPTAADAYALFEYSLLSGCHAQSISIVSEVAGLSAAACAARFFVSGRPRPLRSLLCATTLLSAAAGLLRLLLLRLPDPASTPQLFFRYAVWVGFADSFFSSLAMVALLVLATRCCEEEYAGMYYAVFLSLLDFGNTVGGLVTTPIANSLGISYGHFEPLSELLYIGAACQVAVCVLIPVLLVSSKSGQETRS